MTSSAPLRSPTSAEPSVEALSTTMTRSTCEQERAEPTAAPTLAALLYVTMITSTATSAAFGGSRPPAASAIAPVEVARIMAEPRPGCRSRGRFGSPRPTPARRNARTG
jgi:hypothetical protein